MNVPQWFRRPPAAGSWDATVLQLVALAERRVAHEERLAADREREAQRRMVAACRAS